MFKKIKSKDIGDSAEELAKNYLKNQGLDYVRSNYHSRFGEIDLIFKDQEYLVFVEVRYRKSNQYGHSIETIDKQKQGKIIKTAEVYLYENRLTESINCRFDVIGIEPINKRSNHLKERHSVTWIKNAFNCF